ncbi:insecticidal toxin complex protein TccC [Pseudomonas sp. EB276 TE3739]|uniref:RHS repeat domain-containing protein n=1 Tax=Pseudomonas TaxID=286 RepID=UPI0020A0BE4B|nr:RHS repeat-associated core domain-containing protein [Pseudomonas koreensis]MCP1477630.1 insecticidal toxin complex protein TccC [Pseudomonas koreensis]
MTAPLHWRTPALAVIDGRGLPIRQVAYLRSAADATARAIVTSQEHDVAGRLVAQHDPRLPVANATTVYALNGDVLFTDSVDGGWRLILPGLAGEPEQRWDARGHHWQSTFDTQLRVTTLKEDGDPQIDSFSYGESSADASHNLRGQLIRQTDPSGSLDISSYALTGQPLVEKRTFHDQAEFVSHQVFSPLGAVLEQIDGGGHRRASRYGLAGQLKKVELEVETKVTQVLQDAQYNANDQIISQLAGNGVLSQWTYDPADGRLRARISQKPGQPRLQDLAYFYDRVGNIIRIEDHAFEPTWFANQRVDGHREFSYDSLYRLIHATGHDDVLPPDIPGLPQPPDERNRLNYIQTYSYDDAGNLTELRHQRDGNSRTRTLCIDDKSNRGVRWQTGDEPPDFGTWFDPHGNQRRLHHGPSLHWNSRDELEHIDLVLRKDSANDAEHYRYSQGVRVFKRHDTFAPGANHFHQVRYLPGLEIRSKDNGEELHIISVGNARCLHWVSNPPAANTQLRYTLEDHLGSCVMELDENAAVTSEEGYYPFGETAWMAPESEIAYRFIRYSGKEMDVSGLYYYGARYYAPWLQRWVSADPAGEVDGLNLYGFVGNNPLTFVDVHGNSQEKFDIVNFSNFVTELGNHAAMTQDKMQKIAGGKYAGDLVKSGVAEIIIGTAGFFAGFYGSKFVGSSLTVGMPEAVEYLVGIVSAHIGGDIAESFVSKFTSFANMTAPLIPQTSAMSVDAIDQKVGITESSSSFTPADASSLLMSRGVGSYVPGVGASLNLGSRVQEVEDIKNGLDPAKIEKIETMLADWQQALTSRMADIEKAFRRLGQNTVNSADVLPHQNRLRGAKTIRLETLREQTRAIQGYIESTQTFMKFYKEDLTTDSRFLRSQAQPKSGLGARLKARFNAAVEPFIRHVYAPQ